MGIKLDFDLDDFGEWLDKQVDFIETEKGKAKFEEMSNNELLYLYRVLYKHQLGDISLWKQLEKAILIRMS